MRTIYLPRIQPESLERILFAFHAAASLAVLAAFGAMVMAWSIGLGG
jgi:hypothetical protein